MKRVNEIRVRAGISAGELIQEYARAGVLGAGKLAEACHIFEEMVREKAEILLGLAGPVTASGMRSVISTLIRENIVSAVVCSGANIVHDIICALGGEHMAFSGGKSDEELWKEGLGRIGNVLARVEDFVKFEEFIQSLLQEMPEERLENLSPRELITEIGSKLRDEDSFIRAAFERHIPIFSPGIADSMLGLQLFFFSQKNRICLNVLKDMKELATIVLSAKKVGGIFLGGGIPKHYIMGACLLREGLDYGIQITLDREEGGSLSGAKLEEGISWGKAKSSGRFSTVIGDVTIVFPLLVAGVLERLKCRV